MPQILITIPPHNEDFEVRILLERHVKAYDKSNPISFKLFSFEGQRIIYAHEFLRSFAQVDREMCSDVFIFEASTDYESYVLAILDNNQGGDEETYTSFTLDVFSFVTIDLKELPYRSVDKSYKVKGMWPCEQGGDHGGNIDTHKFVNNP
jgi:hypothetical protein